MTYIVLGGLISLLKFNQMTDEGCAEYDVQDEMSGDVMHFRNWRALSSRKDHCLSYLSMEAVNIELKEERKSIDLDELDYNHYWGSIYQKLITQNANQLQFIRDSLYQISLAENLDRVDFAKMIVSFVQDIPYSYVIKEDCESRDTGNHPCLGNVELGILSPYEFLHTLYGDCDTRAVLLYAVFQGLGYKPMITISNEYAHAMLALNVPSIGKYLSHNKDKYYFWETTATGWGSGMLPPDMNNTDYWKIALVNEL
ncbi:MAG: hypothetical protein JXR03_15505 [Cyclobacteriaceae bacterium]